MDYVAACQVCLLSHNIDYVIFFCALQEQLHPGQGTETFFFCRGGINPGCLNIGMPQNIRKPDDIFFKPVIRQRKQMAQIMGKHFLRFNSGIFAQRLHLSPDIASVQRFSALCDKNGACRYFYILKINLTFKGVILTV